MIFGDVGIKPAGASPLVHLVCLSETYSCRRKFSTYYNIIRRNSYQTVLFIASARILLSAPDYLAASTHVGFRIRQLGRIVSTRAARASTDSLWTWVDSVNPQSDQQPHNAAGLTVALWRCVKELPATRPADSIWQWVIMAPDQLYHGGMGLTVADMFVYNCGRR
jgi:hypothetical protein